MNWPLGAERTPYLGLPLSFTHPRLLEPQGLLLLAELSQRLEAIPGVLRVFSLSNAAGLVHGPDGAEPRPVFPDNPADRRGG